MHKILIANRGEIAERIIRTCEKLGIETVAIFSESDKDMPYVHLATKARYVGEAHPQKSYLNVSNILNIAKEENVDAIHPGYGFLSENAPFANLVREAGIKFIGPSSEIIQLMGDKLQARKEMRVAGVPVVPGTDEAIATVEEACAIADDIGYPVMLKASGGGGGIGMQRCENKEDILKAFDQTRTRAKAYFQNDEVFVEKCIDNARHIEVQVFGDSHGNVVHLFERNCSVQRRNQKVVEEAVSPCMPEDIRQKICQAAVLAAKHVNYENAGTVEFIMGENGEFYFLEMNTRLQVEHPVTESITGLDLVEWQLKVTSGYPLPLKQEEIQQNGHSIEYRIYAEDPKTFYPSPGLINEWSLPEEEGIRIDSGYGPGLKVTPFYDPMIAKLIITAPSREEAIQLSATYFEKVEITGIKTNIPLLKEVVQNDSFKEGSYNTSFLQKAFVAK
ncbi:MULTISPECIES: acetyl-CoA carboxylase biotin carboxylase subunit [Bacillus]|uniref:acetyl-CoA carboxylase biotin carboxylase subunit n=1 Tax=Bacillus TaxID=1386 RepID=UPI000BB9051C|nr:MULTISPECIES: acetyl-CoA carboxylase biotin carboxylase subunit [Bacillus]